jgi:hypothetical protein
LKSSYSRLQQIRSKKSKINEVNTTLIVEYRVP